MGEGAGHPTVHAAVAFLALRRIAQRHMIGRSRLLKCFQVATDTLGREPLAIELAHGAGLVARITIRDGMSPDQRKTVLVLVDGVHRNLPPRDFVAEVALRSILAAMNVGVAILAIRAHARKNRIDMALLAAHVAVHAKEREAGFAVIKLGLTANRLPCRDGVAFFASDFQRAMRTFGFRSDSPLLCKSGGRQLRDQERDK